MKPISLAGSATPFVTGKWYYRKRLSRLHEYTLKARGFYYPQVMQVHCDANGNVRSVLTPSEKGELRVLDREIPKEYYILYEEFTPVTTEKLRFETGKRYRIANRGAIDSMCNLDLGRYGHNTSLRRFLSYGSRRMRDRNVIYIHTATKDGCALKILGSDHASPIQRSFDSLIPGWLLMFLEEVGTDREPIERDPVETMVSQIESLEDNTRRQVNQDDYIDLDFASVHDENEFPDDNGVLVSKEDSELLEAVKFLIEHANVDYGSRAIIRLSADGYTYGVDDAKTLVSWAAKRRQELMRYSDELFSKINDLQALIKKLPK